MSFACIPSLLELSRSVVEKALIRAARAGSEFLAVDGTCGNGHDTLFLAQTLDRLAPAGACGNDHDTLFPAQPPDRLSDRCPPPAQQSAAVQDTPLCRDWTANQAPALAGRLPAVWAFDVQPQALEQTRQAIARAGIRTPVRCIQAGHETLADWLHAAGKTTGDRLQITDVVPIPNLAVAVYNLGYLPGGDKGRITRPETTLLSLRAALDALLPGGVLAVHAYGGHPGGGEELRAVQAWFTALPFSLCRVGRYDVCNKQRNPEALFLAERVAAPEDRM